MFCDDFECHGCQVKFVRDKCFPKGEVKLDKNMTTSHEIEDLLYDNLIPKEIFLGVYPRDHLPKEKLASHPYAMCVVNTHKSGLPGQHFVAIIKDRKRLLFFDSSATPEFYQLFQDDLEQLAEKGGLKLWKNTCPIQYDVSNACGYYCIWFLLKYYFYRPCSIKDMTTLFFESFCHGEKPGPREMKWRQERLVNEIIVNMERIINRRHMMKVLKECGMPINYNFNDFESCKIYYR